MTGPLIALCVLLPIVSGIIALGIKNHPIRAILVICMGIILIVSAVLLYVSSNLPVSYTPVGYATWETVVTILNFALMIFFILVSGLDIRERGLSIHNILPIILTLTAGIPLAIFEFSWAKGAEITPAFYIDHLSVVLLLVISIVGSLICFYAIRYMRDHEEHRIHAGELKGTAQPRFFFFLIVFLGVMNGLVFANNLLWLAFFWEATTFCCWGLIRHDLTPLAKTNALRALWMCLIGSTAFSAAIMLFWNSPLNSISLLTIIQSNILNTPIIYLPLAFLALAAFTKSAQVPFQSWLLGAMVAPTPVSALLHSSTMVNAGVYLLLRLAPSYRGSTLSIFIAIFGGMVFLITSLLAISQTNAKKVLAYSTIANLGLIVLLAGINTPLSIACGMMLLIFHAVSKALLFLTTGAIEHYIWSRDIESMEGLADKLPVLTGIAIAGMFSMIAAPFGVIISKWGGLEAVNGINLWSALILVMLVIGSSATTVFWAKWVGRLLCRAPSQTASKSEKLVPHYHGTLIVLIGLAVVFSILIIPLFNTLISPGLREAGYNSALSFTTSGWALQTSVGIIAAWPLFLVLAGAILLPMALTKPRPEQIRPAYMSGENLEIGSSKFLAIGDQPTDLETGGFYIDKVFGEGTINDFALPIGIVFMCILLILALI